MAERSKLLCRLACALALVCTPIVLLAHPMGNFSVNHYSGIIISREFLQVRYIIDMAEIPTFQELQASGLKPDPNDPRVPQYLKAKEAELRRGIALTIDGRPIPLECGGRQVIFPAGAGGLPTMKVGFTCRTVLSKLGSGLHRIEYRDDNFPGRAGWKEIVVNADPELRMLTDAPSHDRSGGLSNYPTDLLNSPPQDVAASIGFTMPAIFNATKQPAQPAFAEHASKAKSISRIGTSATLVSPPSVPTEPINSAPMKLAPNAQGTPRNAFTQLMTMQRLSLWFLLTAAFIAAGLGALHALEPGHGKTLVAAYLAGSRGTAWHAILLGLIVTLAHTASVYVLGAITLYASRYILPDKLYPWIGAVSGVVVAGFGLLLFLRRWAGHDPSLNEEHKHWHDRFVTSSLQGGSVAGTAVALAKEPISLRQLLVLGITGGFVPCPAALVVLLSALALHRIAFGFFLILAFSFGLAAVLIGMGLLIVQAGRLISKLDSGGPLIRRQLPLLSAGLITIVGIGLTLQSLRSAGLGSYFGVFSSPKWLFIAGIGLLLGMRHSTDPDHVIAVTTIVARLRQVRHASVVGAIWGVGHTLTIFVVGSAIILFGIVIPPRIGLSMEFAVALMLILLGILNLTGVLAWITRRFSPSGDPEAQSPESKPSGSARLLDRAFSRFGAYQLVRPLVIGIVHGLAGSAAVALLVLATIHNPVWAIGYLLLFGLGTIAGMMIMTAVIAVPVVWTGKNSARLNRYMCATSGIISLGFGLFLVYQIGFVSGLFRAVPNWVPS